MNHPARLSDAVILPELPQNAAHFGRRFLYTENHSLYEWFKKAYAQGI